MSAARRILRSRVFVISIILWVLLLFFVSGTARSGISSHTLTDGIPAYKTTTIDEISGGNLLFFAQTFDSYGNGVQGVSLYYNITQVNSVPNSFVKGGFAGITNSTGFQSINLTGINPSYTYFIDEHFFDAAIGYNYTISGAILYSPHQGAYGSANNYSVTPVKSSTNSNNYAFHVWKAPGSSTGNVTVFYQSSTSLQTFFYTLSPFNYSNTIDIGSYAIPFQKNVQSSIPMQGVPYFYGVGVRDSSQLLGQAFFSTLPTPYHESKYLFGFYTGLSALILPLWVFAILTLASLPGENDKRKSSWYIPGIVDPTVSGGRMAKFRRIVINSVISVAPFIASELIIVSLLSWRYYSFITPIVNMAVYSAILFLACAIASSAISFLLNPKYKWLLYREERKNGGNGFFARGIFIVGIIVVFDFYFFLNAGMLFLLPISSFQTVLINLINPFAYPFAVLQYLNGVLYFTGSQTISPSSLGLSVPMLISIGIFWLFVWFVLPSLVYRRLDRS